MSAKAKGGNLAATLRAFNAFVYANLTQKAGFGPGGQSTFLCEDSEKPPL